MLSNEKELLEKCRGGDIEAFEQLILGYEKKVFNIAYRMMGNMNDASEMAQEVFIKVYKSIRNFKEESSFSTWVYRITSNACVDELRKRKKIQSVSIDEDFQLPNGEMRIQVTDPSPGPEKIAEKNELRALIEEALQELSEEHRSVIILRDLNGFSYEEIGKMLDCPSGTIKSRINRARQSLKNILIKKKELTPDDYV